MTQGYIQAYTSFKFVSSRYKQKYNRLCNCSFHFLKVFIFTVFRHNPYKVTLPRNPYTFILLDQVSLSELSAQESRSDGRKVMILQAETLVPETFLPLAIKISIESHRKYQVSAEHRVKRLYCLGFLR